MKKYLFLIATCVIALVACNKEQASGALNATITIQPNPCDAGEKIKFSANVTGGKSPYTYKWTAEVNRKQTDLDKNEPSFEWTFGVNGTYKVTLVVTDAAGSKVEKKKNLVVNPSKIDEKGELTLVWNGYMEGYSTISSAAVDDNGNVYATTQALKLYKFSPSGETLWCKPIISRPSTDSHTFVTPTVDSDGTVYVGGGTVGPDGVYVAFNPDGTEKWRFKDFYNTEAPSPAIQATMAAIGDENVYVGNVGTFGTITSINKATGKRVNFCRRGASNPTGGARTGVVLSKAGTLHWYGGMYGIYGAPTSPFDVQGDGVDYKWRMFGDGNSPEFAKVTPMGGLALVTINGKSNVCGMASDMVGTKVYAIDCAEGTLTSVCYIDDTEDQDQGGVVVTKDGYLVASLNYTLGHDNGGLVMVNPADGTIVSRYSVQEKVAGSAAIDAAGNIHFGTEAGFYYIVKPTGDGFELLVKRNIADIIKKDSRYASTYAEMYTAKAWSSVVIGDDGKMYICFTDNDTRLFGGVACLTYEGCTGPAASEWPMVGRDRRHTCKQK